MHWEGCYIWAEGRLIIGCMFSYILVDGPIAVGVLYEGELILVIQLLFNFKNG